MVEPSIRTTLQALIEEENTRTMDARDRLGSFVPLGQDALRILNTFITSIDRDHFLAAALMLSIQKAAALAFLSYIRGHIAQGEFNARMTIEFSALCAYLIAHPDTDVTTGSMSEASGFVKSKVLSRKAYKWLDKELARHSSLLSSFKDMINESTAHANMYLTHFNFEWESGNEERAEFRGSFFDAVDDNVFRLYISSFARLILVVVQTLRLVAEKHGGFTLSADLETNLLRLEQNVEAHRSALAGRMGGTSS